VGLLGLYWQRRKRQMALPGFEDEVLWSSHQCTWLIGDFYESMAAKQLDAELYEPKMRAHEKGSLVPDLASWRWDLLYEVKAASWPRCKFKVFWSQIESYEHFSKQEFPWDNPGVYYVFFGHEVAQIVDNYGTETKLIQGLAKRTKYMVVVPLEIILAMQDVYPRNTFDGKWADVIQPPQRMILNFQLNPKRAFKILGMDHKEFSCVNLWSKPCRALKWGVSIYPMTLVWRKGTTPPHLTQRKGRKTNGTHFVV